MRALKVEALYVYPLKSAAGISLDNASMDTFGVVNDRRWMLVDATGKFLSQRTHPRMALLRVRCEGSQLTVEAPGTPPLIVLPPSDSAERRQVIVWKDSCEAVDCGESAAAWMSDFLSYDCRLAYCPGDMVRYADPEYVCNNERISFVDGFPLLIIGRASLDDLNRRLVDKGESTVSMDRFRPNIVVSGGLPYAEDDWKEILIGDDSSALRLRIVKPCIRCSIVPVDQTTGIRGTEPLATLSTYRSQNGRVYFGQKAVHQGVGPIRVGDSIHIVG